MQHPNLVVVQSYASHPEADLTKGALEAGGIPAMIQSDSVGGMREHLAWSGAGFKILVREGDVTMHAKCWLRQLKATKSQTPTPKLTPTRDHRGAGLPSKSS
jgi:hypothetical protein